MLDEKTRDWCVQDARHSSGLKNISLIQPRPNLFPSWRAVRSYRPQLEEREPIWDDDWSHSPFIRLSPSWGFPQLYGKCQEIYAQSPESFHYHPIIIISDRRDWRDTRGKLPLARNPDRSWWHRHINWKFFWPQPMALWTTGFLSELILFGSSYELRKIYVLYKT